MFDRDAESSKRAVDELRKPGMRQKLVTFATWRMGGEQKDAEDIVQEALAKVMDPDDSPWDPSKRGFLTHVGSILNGLASNQRRSARSRREILDFETAPEGATADNVPLPDEALGEHRAVARLRRLGSQLRALLVARNDVLAVQVLDCASEGLEEPAEVIQRVGCTVDQLEDTHRRLKYHAKPILAEEEEAEKRSMKEKRDRAAKKEVTP